VAGYVLADVEWVDQEAYRRYAGMIEPSLEPFGGTFVVGTREVEVREGDWEHRGVLVLIRFPSLEQARAWYGSQQYLPAREIRKSGSNSRLMIFEGD
jgi:uncharacterized protein (DUF1330 family)